MKDWRTVHVKVWVDGLLEMDMRISGAEPNHSAVKLQAERQLALSSITDPEIYNWEVVPDGKS